jgi:hypothetical protein
VSATVEAYHCLSLDIDKPDRPSAGPAGAASNAAAQAAGAAGGKKGKPAASSAAEGAEPAAVAKRNAASADDNASVETAKVKGGRGRPPKVPADAPLPSVPTEAVGGVAASTSSKRRRRASVPDAAEAEEPAPLGGTPDAVPVPCVSVGGPPNSDATTTAAAAPAPVRASGRGRGGGSSSAVASDGIPASVFGSMRRLTEPEVCGSLMPLTTESSFLLHRGEGVGG